MGSQRAQHGTGRWQERFRHRVSPFWGFVFVDHHSSDALDEIAVFGGSVGEAIFHAQSQNDIIQPAHAMDQFDGRCHGQRAGRGGGRNPSC